MKIAIVTICTGQYNAFLNQFIQSSIKNFFIDATYRHWYIFTDINTYKNQNNISYFYAQHNEWPFVALKKFYYISSISNELNYYDYIFLINVNTLFYKKIVIGQIGTDGCKQLIAYKHVWPYCSAVKNQQIFNELLDLKTESNIKSKAYINIRPYTYCQSSFIGGMAIPFLKMCKELNDMTDYDLKNHIIPVWHDESYVNKYIVDNYDKFVLLSEKFATHENLPGYECTKMLEYVASIKFLDKEKVFNLYSFKDRYALNSSSSCIFLDGYLENQLYYIANNMHSIKNNNSVQFAISKNIDICQLMTVLKKLNINNYYIQTTNKITFDNLQHNYEKPLHINDIKQQFNKLINQKNKIDLNIDFNNCVCIDVMRKSTELINNKQYNLSKEYYLSAYKKFFNKNYVIINTDDKQWVKENLSILNGKIINDYKINQLEILNILTHCKNYIGSYSLFSWWTAFLGEKKDSTIIFPKIKTNMNINTWIQIDY